MDLSKIPKLAIRYINWGTSIDDDGNEVEDEYAIQKLGELVHEYFPAINGKYTMFNCDAQTIYDFLRELEKCENWYGDWTCEVYYCTEEGEQKSWEKDTTFSVDSVFEEIIDRDFQDDDAN